MSIPPPQQGANIHYHLEPPRKTNWAAWILGGIALLCVCPFGGFLACSALVAKSAVDSQTAEQDALRNQTPINISAVNLVHDYNTNEVAADNQYKGKVLAVSGQIDMISKGLTGSPYVTLKSDPNNPYMADVQCTFDNENDPNLAAVATGQSVTIKGLCDGRTITAVFLKHCEVENK